MSLFDEIESAAFDTLIGADLEVAGLYRYDNSQGESDGFNKELKRSITYIKQIDVNLTRGGTTNNSEYIGTTTETDIAQGDVLEIINHRGKKRRWTVTGFEPTKNHTMLELDEVRDGS